MIGSLEDDFDGPDVSEGKAGCCDAPASVGCAVTGTRWPCAPWVRAQHPEHESSAWDPYPSSRHSHTATNCPLSPCGDADHSIFVNKRWKRVRRANCVARA
jgi:hypothetical protein